MRLPPRLIPTLVHLLLIRPVLRLVFGVHVEGRENLDGLERFILVANHNSHLDVLLLFSTIPSRLLWRTHPVAAYEYFSRSRILLHLVDYLLQPVWLDRTGRGRMALDQMRERLLHGHSLLIFPEGTRGRAGVIAPFKSGVGELAAEFPDVPILPAFITGTERALPKGNAMPVPVWNRLVISAPQFFTGTRREITTALEATAQQLALSEAASQHSRSTARREIPTLAVIGIDGSGKSTLARGLSRELSRQSRTCLISDDVEFYENGERLKVQLLLAEKLREAIGRRAKQAGSLATYKIPKLVELLLRDRMIEKVRHWYAPEIVVMDGSPLLNVVAWAGLLRPLEIDATTSATLLRVLAGSDAVDPDHAVYSAFPELLTLKRLYLARLELPDAVLFLDADPRLSMQRIDGRGQPRQTHENMEGLSSLSKGYRLVCQACSEELGLPVVALESQPTIALQLQHALVEIGHLAMTTLGRRDHVTSGENGNARSH